MPTTKSRLLKVILLGDGGVGKSSLMNRFVIERFDINLYHTIGVEFLNKDIEIMESNFDIVKVTVNAIPTKNILCDCYLLVSSLTVNGENINVTLQIWDTAGQERFRSLRTPFYRGADCCLLVFAVDDRRSFEELAEWKREFIHYAGVGDDFPFVVLGNKIDIEDKRQVTDEEAEEWCRQNTVTKETDLTKDYNLDNAIKYYSTSAKDSIGVTEAFTNAAKRILTLASEQDLLNQTPLDAIILKAKENRTSSCPC